MPYSRRIARPDQTTRELAQPHRRSMLLDIVRGLFVDAPAAPGGGGAAPAAPAAPAPAPAAKPAAAAPAAPAAPAPAAKPAAAPAAAPAAKEGELESVIGPAAAKPAAEPAKPATVDEQRAYLVEKAGVKADDAAKLTEADLKTQYDAAKAKEAAPAAGEVKPEDIKLTIPEGIKVDEAQQAEFKTALLDPKLTPQARAQKLFDLHTAALKAHVEQNFQTWKETQVGWQKEVRADKEIGGANYDASRAAITKAIEQIMGKDAPTVYEAMKFTGAGNNPAIVRLMTRIGKLLGEGDHVGGDAPGAAKSRSFAQRVAAMYPSASGSQSTAPAGG